MADEFHNWWDTSRNRFESGTTTTAIPTSINSSTLNSIASYGWQTDMKSTRPCMDHSEPDSGGSNLVLQRGLDQQSSNSTVLANTNLQMMGLGLSSQTSMDNWNQTLIGEKTEGNLNFRSMLQEDTGEDFKRGLQFNQATSNDSSTITSQQNLNSSGFQVDSAYGLLLSDNNNNTNNQQHSLYENRPMNYSYPTTGYGASASELMPSSWNKFPQFLRTSPPPKPPAAAGSSHLHFTNDTPFWNASAPSMNDNARSNFFQTQIPGTTSSFDDHKPKITSEVRDLGTPTKKNNTEVSNKRPRSETPSPLPAFKVRKEKMGDRITALQQLVSPFGKTDTASVLSEAIEYIKFLHEQVNVLSTPYMKNGAPIQHQQQNSDKSKDPEGPRQDLRSRGLCLVPVSSTFPVTHETTVDFWTPTFGGTFR
ncbi:hypothetical protein ACJIZ3_012677 [Penstemon smallii]|uniref:BHLH domain-containing protein n=1 Tax=Penstemon smallii TaxID=265156 RepID=A0ABD3UR93_9LAMI